MSDFSLSTYTGGLVATNGHFLTCGETRLLIDAPDGVFDWLAAKGETPDAILLTHQHFDHVEDAHRFDCPIHAFSPMDRDLILDARAREWGLPVKVEDFKVGKILKEEPTLTIGQLELQLIHVPGHSPDSLVYHLPALATAFAGDTLFCGGVGRTDLPGGSHETLISGIREKLLTLPPQTTFYPGHGPSTTAADEQENPFL
ncbi:MAG: MBL fold metallo-hydrolase [Verrucomicrobiota bacterium JB023]|nr:MBL fold metallo-hydrolase [Verrucomicrobiota bacterium JB023]